MCSVAHLQLALSPGSLTEISGGAQRERAWYTLFMYALIISAIMHICVILENIRGIRHGCVQNTMISKKYCFLVWLLEHHSVF